MLRRLAWIHVAKFESLAHVCTDVLSISYCIRYVLSMVIAWGRVPHIGYWHCSGLEPEDRRGV